MKKIISLLLLSSLVFTMFACSKNDEDESSTEQASQVEENKSEADIESSEEDSDEVSEYVKSDNFYGGETLTIYGKSVSNHPLAKRQWEYDSELEGDAINEAVQDRNNWLYENYGITVKYIENDTGEFNTTAGVMKMINSGTDSYDIICDNLLPMATMASDGYFYELNNIEYLDLSHSWWDQRSISELSIANKVYYVAGDILITDDNYTYGILFNKSIIDKNNVSELFDGRSLYQVVNDGEWTYDALFIAAKRCAESLTGESAMTLDDIWGYIGDTSCIAILMQGGGYTMCQKDAKDVPALNVVDENSSALFSKITGYVNDKSFCNFAAKLGVEGDYNLYAIDMFANGLITFYHTNLSALSGVLSNDALSFAVGVLPTPKATSEQTAYYNSAANYHFSCIGIPNSVKEDRLELVCDAIEALGYFGQRELTPAFIELTLKGKRADTADDEDMINLILVSRCFDLAQIYNWGGLNMFYNKFCGASSVNLVSAWDSISGSAKDAMQGTIEQFANADNN